MPDGKIFPELYYDPLSKDLSEYVDEYQISRGMSRIATTNTTRVRSPLFSSKSSNSRFKKKKVKVNNFKIELKKQDILVKYNFEESFLNETYSKSYIRKNRQIQKNFKL